MALSSLQGQTGAVSAGGKAHPRPRPVESPAAKKSSPPSSSEDRLFSVSTRVDYGSPAQVSSLIARVSGLAVT